VYVLLISGVLECADVKLGVGVTLGLAELQDVPVVVLEGFIDRVTETVPVLVLEFVTEPVDVCVIACVLEFLTEAENDVDEEDVLDGRIDAVAVVDFVDVLEELIDPEVVEEADLVFDSLGLDVSVLVGRIDGDMLGLLDDVFDTIGENDKTAVIVPVLDAVDVRVLVLEGAIVIDDSVDGVTLFVGLSDTLWADVRVEVLLGIVDCVGMIPRTLRYLSEIFKLYAVRTFNNRIKRRGLLILLYRIVFLP
jgi:hypothetical protein